MLTVQPVNRIELQLSIGPQILAYIRIAHSQLNSWKTSSDFVQKEEKCMLISLHKEYNAVNFGRPANICHRVRSLINAWSAGATLADHLILHMSNLLCSMSDHLVSNLRDKFHKMEQGMPSLKNCQEAISSYFFYFPTAYKLTVTHYRSYLIG